MEGRGVSGRLGQWARFVHAHPWIILGISVLFLAASLGIAAGGGNLQNTYTRSTESAQAADLIAAQIAHREGPGFVLVFTSAKETVNDSAFRAEVTRAVAPLVNDSQVQSVITPWNAPAQERAALIGKDGREAAVIVTTRPLNSTSDNFPTGAYGALRAKVHTTTLTVDATGSLAIDYDFNQILDQDLQRAEEVSIPASVLLLLIVFGTLVAALVPVGVGALAVVGGVAAVFVLSQSTTVSPYALNITTLIGLGVAIDYSLFIVNRFREEILNGKQTGEALEIAMSTTGRSVLFSGVTVAVGLSGMLFFQGSFLVSMGIAGAVVVALAVFYALTFLPALLSVLGPRVNALRIPFVRRKGGAGRRFWHGLAEGVMRRPVAVLLPVLAILLVAGTPFLGAKLGGGDVTLLPKTAESRIGYDLLQSDFPSQGGNEITIVLDFGAGNPLSASSIAAIANETKTIAGLHGVDSTASITTINPNFTTSQYQAFYAQRPSAWPAPVRELVNATIGTHIALITATTSFSVSSDGARSIVTSIRALPPQPGAHTLVTGSTALDQDTVTFILAKAPIVAGYVVLVTYVILLWTFRSVILPLKAVVMNLLSITASFGALVYVFQDGHFAGQLGFTPGDIIPEVPVILFCTVFGLSMDYEVLILSRMREHWLKSRDNRAAVATGLERTGGLVTGAASIMVLVFAAFALARIVVVQSIGFGLALAVAIDATLVRALVVPATMRLLGDLNWWAPRFLRGREGGGEPGGGH
ncbi:MAG: MMPL family transporter [Thermoplasmatota archaeon]